MKKRKVIILNRKCVDCGKQITVKIDAKTKRILSKHWYYGKHRFGIGDWTYGILETNPFRIVKTVPLHKEIYYRLRDIYRTIFHKYEEVEFWVCEDCIKVEHGNIVKVRSKNPSKRYDEAVEVEGKIWDVRE